MKPWFREVLAGEPSEGHDGVGIRNRLLVSWALASCSAEREIVGALGGRL